MAGQKGFTLVEGLLITLILSVVGFAGYMVWNNSQDDEPDRVEKSQQGAGEGESSSNSLENINKSKSGSTVSGGFSTSTPDTWSSDYLEIKEVGLKMQLSEGLSDMYYHISNSSESGVLITLSTKKLSDLEPLCAAENTEYGGIGTIFSFTDPDSRDPITGFEPIGTYLPDSIKVNGVYYAIRTDGGSKCSGLSVRGGDNFMESELFKEKNDATSFLRTDAELEKL